MIQTGRVYRQTVALSLHTYIDEAKAIMSHSFKAAWHMPLGYTKNCIIMFNKIFTTRKYLVLSNPFGLISFILGAELISWVARGFMIKSSVKKKLKKAERYYQCHVKLSPGLFWQTTWSLNWLIRPLSEWSLIHGTYKYTKVGIHIKNIKFLLH